MKIAVKNSFFLFVLLLLVSCSGNKKKEAEARLAPIMEKALNEPLSRFYGHFDNFPKEKKMLPIGVFDSGTGGLTVLEVLLTVDRMNNITGSEEPDGIPDFIGENFTYLADQANMPYGNYSSEGKDDYLKELVVKDALFLLGDKYYRNAIDKEPLGEKEPAKILVIACNTATAYGLGDVRTLLEQSNTGVKVIGVINAGVNALFDILEPKDSVAVGVMATVGTIDSGAYERTIHEMAGERGYEGVINVVNQPGAGFAEAVDSEKDFVNRSLEAPRESYRGPRLGDGPDDIKPELLPVYNFDFGNNAVLYEKEGDSYKEFQLNSAANYARFHLVSLVEKHRSSGTKVPLESVILGCTHYPFLLDTLQAVIKELRAYKVNGKPVYGDIIAEDFTFLDPAVYTAVECYKTLRQDNELALRTDDGKLDAYISVPAFGLEPGCTDENGNLTYDFKYGRQCGTEDVTTVSVPFSRRYLQQDNLDRIESLLPASYNQIKKIID